MCLDTQKNTRRNEVKTYDHCGWKTCNRMKNVPSWLKNDADLTARPEQRWKMEPSGETVEWTWVGCKKIKFCNIVNLCCNFVKIVTFLNFKMSWKSHFLSCDTCRNHLRHFYNVSSSISLCWCEHNNPILVHTKTAEVDPAWLSVQQSVWKVHVLGPTQLPTPKPL